MIVGIDGSNIREGGGLNHIFEILDKYEFNKHNITKIILWGNSKLLLNINDNYFIKKKRIF